MMMSGRADKARRFRQGGAGFTFIEMMLVLALIAVMFVAAVPLASSSIREQRLRSGMESIEEMMREQRREAQKSGLTRRIEVRASGFFERADKGRELLKTPRSAKMSVKLPGGDWDKPLRQVIEFSPSGLVTPASVRLEEGKDWIEVDFDVLTGRVAEERYAF